MMSKPVVCLNDDPADNDKLVTLRSVGCSKRSKASQRMARNFGQPEATCNWGKPLTIETLWSAFKQYKTTY